MVGSDMPLGTDKSDASHVDIPAVYLMAMRGIDDQTLLVCSSVDYFHFGETDALFVTRGSWDSRDHHKFDQFLGLGSELPSLGLLKPVFGAGNALVGEALEELWGLGKVVVSIGPWQTRHWSMAYLPLAACLAKIPFL